MSNWIPEILQGVFGSILASAIGGIALMVWGKLQKQNKWSNPHAVFYGIVTTAALFFIFNQIGWEPPIRIKIRQWLDNVSYSVRPLQGSTTIFHYEVTDQQGLKLYILQYKDRYPSMVLLRIGYNFESSFPSLKELDEKKQMLLSRKFRRNLDIIGVGYEKPKYPLKTIKPSYVMPAMSLTQENLFDGVNRLRHGLNSITHEIALELHDYRQ